MLRYVSFALGICTSAATVVLGVTWLYLHDEIRNSSSLHEEFHSTIRRMIVTLGIFAIPFVAYFLTPRKSLNDGELYALIWIGCYFVSLLFLATGLSILIRDAKRERKTGLYRFRR
jgi:cytochrome bd-type quinol oxidase subunit 2